MPIRKRLSDPYSQETIDFDRHRKYGKPPPAPKKPTAEERKPFYEAIHAIPIGHSFTNALWRERWIIPFMKRQYELWGVSLALYPTARRDSANRDVCTGVLVCMLDKSRITGQFPKLKLDGDSKLWYGKVILWLQEQKYGG